MSSFRRAACVVLLRKNQGQSTEPYEVFLVKRNPHLHFMGGFHVFPGGTLDPEDSKIPVLGYHQAELRVAAARELFEETGILATHSPNRPSNEVSTTLRKELLKGKISFEQILHRYEMTISGKDFIDFGRWITPQFSPIRFDALYFAVLLPPNQTPSIVPGELIDGFWCTPQSALLGHQNSQYFITYPVLETLKIIRDCQGNLSQAGHQLCAKEPDAYPTAGGEMIRGVHILPLASSYPGPTHSTNTFILGEQDAVVVDPGTNTQVGSHSLIQYMKLMIHKGTTFRALWLTHSNPAHIAAAKALSIQFGLPIVAHPECAKRLPKEISINSFFNDGDSFVLQLDNTRAARWQVFHTPGISPGHVVFYEMNQKHLISGNTVISVPLREIQNKETDLNALKSSLNRLRKLPLGIIFPGHGPSIATGKQAISRMLANLVP